MSDTFLYNRIDELETQLKQKEAECERLRDSLDINNLDIEVITERAYKSLRLYQHTGARGQMLTEHDTYEYHLIKSVIEQLKEKGE